MAMNKYGGVNDMPEGFTKDPLGKRVYVLWFGMLRRCYDYSQQNRKKGKSYANVVVCERWFYLKNFYEDIQKLDGYSEWAKNNSMSLDKDIAAQEVTKIYSPSTCKFVTMKENIQEMNAGFVCSSIANGTPLPKGHGRLIDADAFERRCMFDSDIEDMQDIIYALRDYKPIIEVESEK